MPGSMDHITAMLADWLLQHNINPDDVRLAVEFPDERRAHEARMSFKLDWPSGLIWAPGPSKLNGVEVEFRRARK